MRKKEKPKQNIELLEKMRISNPDRIKTCLNCSDEYVRAINVKEQKFCCKQCSDTYKNANSEMIEVICSNCNEIFLRKKTVAVRSVAYCSIRCELEHKHSKNNKITTCEICEVDFEQLNSENKRFCSIKCQGVWQSQTLVGENANNYNKIISKEERTIVCEMCNAEIQVFPSKIESQRFCSKECSRNWFENVFSQDVEYKEMVRKRTTRLMENGTIGNHTNTSIQTKINEVLDKNKINYIREKSINYSLVDNFLVDYNLCIENMGTYWHCDCRKYDTIKYGNQLTRIRMDKIKNVNLINSGSSVLYLWEDDINKNIGLCELLIKEFINNNGKLNNYHSMNYHILDGNIVLNEKIIIPYMDKDIGFINSITEQEVTKKISKKQNDKWVIFNCDTCGNPKERLISKFEKTKNHFCSNYCKSKWSKGES